MKKIVLYFGILGAMILSVVFIGSVNKVGANPLSYVPIAATATATTTQTMVGTNATSTYTYDAYAAAGQARPSLGASLLLQETASSTSAVLAINFQYSEDGIDWYEDTYDLSVATTSVPVNIKVNRTYVWTPGTTATSLRIIKINTPVRYTRVNFAATVATSSIWAHFVPFREIAE